MTEDVLFLCRLQFATRQYELLDFLLPFAPREVSLTWQNIVLESMRRDPYLYREPGQTGAYRLIWHCGCSYKIGRSFDGVTWDTFAPMHSTGWCVGNYTDGTPFEVARRERPQLILDPNGLPTHISTAVQPQGGGPSWTAVAPLGP